MEALPVTVRIPRFGLHLTDIITMGIVTADALHIMVIVAAVADVRADAVVVGAGVEEAINLTPQSLPIRIFTYL